MIRQTLSHYTILERLGAGGMGVVYKAQDQKLDRVVALKFLPSDLTRDDQAKQRFIQEAKAASALDHPNICTVHEIGESDDGELFIVMGYYEGETLKERIEQGPLPVKEALRIVLEIARGLTRAHDSGIIHRDVKPANVMITKAGDVKILDFGLAKLGGSTALTRTGSTMGTAAYMSPEQVNGQTIDHQTDIWSLGVVLYEALTGKKPFESDYEEAMMYTILNEEPKPLKALVPDLSRDVQQIVSKAMTKAKKDRYQTMREFAGDLDLAKSGDTTRIKTIAAQSAEYVAKKKTVRRVSVVGVVAVVLIAAYFLLQPLIGDQVLASNPKSVLVVSFENESGDTTLQHLRNAIPTLLVTRLEESRYLRVITQERLRDLVRNMGKGEPKYIDQSLGTEVCMKEQIGALVVGSFTRAGDFFVSDLKVLDPATKEILKTARAQGKGVESLLATQIDELSKEIQGGIGLSKRRIEQSDKTLAQLLTSSPQALDWYLKGREASYNMELGEATRCFKEAVKIDTAFAAAYWGQYFAEWWMGNPTKGNDALKRAHSLAWGAPDKMRLLIEADYAGGIENNPPKQSAVLRDLIKRFPQEVLVYEDIYLMGDDTTLRKGVLQKIIELDPSNELALNEMKAEDSVKFANLAKIVQYHPKNTNALDTWVAMLLQRGKYDDALSKCAEIAKRSSSPMNGFMVSFAYALKEEYDLAISSCTSDEGLMRGLCEYFSGSESAALRSLRQVKDTSEMRTMANAATLVSGWIQLEKKRYGEARKSFERFADATEREYLLRNEAHGRDRNPLYQFSLGYLEFLGGNPPKTRKHIEILNSIAGMKRDSIGRYRQNAARVAARYLLGELLLSEGNAKLALDTIRGNSPGVDGNLSFENHMVIYNIPFAFRDLRMRALLKNGKTEAAIKAYEGFLSTRYYNSGRVHIISPVFHLRLGRLCEQAGQREKAAEQYRVLLKIWKNADKNLPELAETRAALARVSAKK